MSRYFVSKQQFLRQGTAGVIFLALLINPLSPSLSLAVQDNLRPMLRTESVSQTVGLEELKVGLQAGLEEFSIDEPQLKKRNVYAKSLQAAVHGPEVTEESKKRWRILKKIGPEIERVVQRAFGESVKIALVPLGSSLKGYSTKTSDVEYQIYILDGFNPEVFSIDYLENMDGVQEVFAEAMKFLEREGLIPEGLTEYFAGIDNMTSITHGEARDGDVKDPKLLATLFLPVAYGDKKLIETARKNALSLIGRQDSPQHSWRLVKSAYLEFFEIDPTVLASKSHLRDWLSAQKADVTPQGVRAFNRERNRKIGRPTFEDMWRIYFKSAPPGTVATDNSGLEEIDWEKVRELVQGARDALETFKREGTLAAGPIVIPEELQKKMEILSRAVAAKHPDRGEVLSALDAVLDWINQPENAEHALWAHLILEGHYFEPAKLLIVSGGQNQQWPGFINPDEILEMFIQFEGYAVRHGLSAFTPVGQSHEEAALLKELVEGFQRAVDLPDNNPNSLARARWSLYSSRIFPGPIKEYREKLKHIVAKIPFLLAVESQTAGNLSGRHTLSKRLIFLRDSSAVIGTLWARGEINLQTDQDSLMREIFLKGTMENLFLVEPGLTRFSEQDQRTLLSRLLSILLEPEAPSNAGLEEVQIKDISRYLDEALRGGPGVLVIEANVISRRMGLAEFIAHVPPRLAERIVLFGTESMEARELAARNGIAVVDSDKLTDLAFQLMLLGDEADQVGFIGNEEKAHALSEILPRSMVVTPFNPATALDQLLRFLKYPQAVLDEINASGLEEQFARFRSA